jgi:hypothetical protein
VHTPIATIYVVAIVAFLVAETPPVAALVYDH